MIHLAADFAGFEEFMPLPSHLPRTELRLNDAPPAARVVKSLAGHRRRAMRSPPFSVQSASNARSIYPSIVKLDMDVNIVIFHVDLVDRTNVRDMANFQGSYTSSLMIGCCNLSMTACSFFLDDFATISIASPTLLKKTRAP